jgi:hypothetical protein
MFVLPPKNNFCPMTQTVECFYFKTPMFVSRRRNEGVEQSNLSMLQKVRSEALHLGGNDKFNNLRILHKEVQQLIHQTHKETIDVLMIRLGITDLMKIKINQYREKYGLGPV